MMYFLQHKGKRVRVDKNVDPEKEYLAGLDKGGMILERSVGHFN